MLTRRAAFGTRRLSLVLLLLSAAGARADDWPMWRHDVTRSASSPQKLAASLHLQWVRHEPPLKPAWPDQAMMQFDAHYEPVVVGKTAFVASSRADSVTALDMTSGEVKWRFFADGPVRFSPAAWEGRLYFVCDDGYLYCLDAAKGELLWKFRGGPSDRKVLGNERLVSTWPARGAPALHDGKVYFAASVWPFMGTFIHSLDARTGRPVWSSDGDGSVYIKQPHNADSFAGVAPQGHLVVSGKFLLVPGGRSIPAIYELNTGKFLKYELAQNGKRGGGSAVTAAGKYFFNGAAAFELKSQKHLGAVGEALAVDGRTAYTWTKDALRALDLGKAAETEEETVDRKGKKTKTTKWKVPELGKIAAKKPLALIKAGGRLYVGDKDSLAAYELPLKADAAPSWEARGIRGNVVSLVAAADRLIAVTREGSILCFGAEKVEKAVEFRSAQAAQPAPDVWTKRAREALDTTGVRAGYCVVWGAGSGRLVSELLRQSDLRLIVVERDAKKVAALRGRLADEGVPFERASVHAGDPVTFALPPYLASLMVSENLAAAGIEPNAEFARKVFHALRPYGGAALLPIPEPMSKPFVGAAEKLAGAKVRADDAGLLLVREGALPGAGDWTHEHADAANTRVSKDTIVKAPLGVLWFGGPSHDGILPRHGHGPQPQVLDGRLFIEGVDMIRATDVYTGRLLWEAKLPGVGKFYNNLLHQPGANVSGSNYVSTRDGIYVAYGDSCVRLDPATGKRLGAFTLPAVPGAKEAPLWGYINVAGDCLITGADPLLDLKFGAKVVTAGKAGDDPDPADKDKKEDEKKDGMIDQLIKKYKWMANDSLSSSKHLVVMDRATGKVLWTAAAKSGFRHNAICAGGGRLYAIDRLSGPQLDKLKRRGEEPKDPAVLIVFDLNTGKKLWETKADVFGTWLSYSEKHDVVIEAGRVARDTLMDEPKGMRAYRAGDGKVLWHDKAYAGPAMIHGDTILKDTSACDLLTGKAKNRVHPLTGEASPWSWVRNYGCNTPMASQHLLTFRSGAAGYFDLCGDSGTGNFGGFRSSCTNNLVVAGGVLTAPDYTRTCTCLYQNQTSIGMIHMPENEMWTTFGVSELKEPIRRLGINLGAPGDRRAADGTLWLEYPSVAGKSPAVPIKTGQAKVQWFRRHETAVAGEGPAWVGASGAKGLAMLAVNLGAGGGTRRYAVRLHFLEPDSIKSGERVFSVKVQGREVLTDFDVVQVAGGPLRGVIREFRGVEVRDTLTVTLRATAGVPVLSGVEVRVEE